MKKWIAVFLLVLSGCAIWQRTGGLFEGAGYTLDLPPGWMATKNPKHLYITRDGPALQQVLVFIGDITKQDKNDKKPLKQGMLPQEVAENILDKMRSDKSLGQFTVVENTPARLDGRDGFRIVYTYRINTVRYRSVYYGMLRGDTFYRISYSAPVRYYFDKDVAVFEEIAKSFRLSETKSRDTAQTK